MYTEILLKYSYMAFIALCAGILIMMARKRLLSEYPSLAALLCAQAVCAVLSLSILFFRSALGIELHLAYKIYFYGYWILFVCEEILQVLVIYSAFSAALKPLKGLHNIGKVIFRWVAAVSVMVSVAIAAGPHFVSSGYIATVAIAGISVQVQQGISVLTLCLLLFVCFSTRPLGLTYRSRTFGIVLGLGVIAMITLVQSAWTAVAPNRSVYSPTVLFGMLGTCVAVAVWGTYLAMPEPERKLILLPTTSPFFFWNRISEALGDAPGHVAIAGFRPDMLAPAEMQMLSAPSMKRIEHSTEISMPAPATLFQSAASH